MRLKTVEFIGLNPSATDTSSFPWQILITHQLHKSNTKNAISFLSVQWAELIWVVEYPYNSSLTKQIYNSLLEPQEIKIYIGLLPHHLSKRNTKYYEILLKLVHNSPPWQLGCASTCQLWSSPSFCPSGVRSMALGLENPLKNWCSNTQPSLHC